MVCLMKLRDALLASVSGLPGTRDFHLHVLVSAPRRYSGLFPYATARPRLYAQDVLVLLSEQSPTLDAPRVLVAAIEAAVYNIPATSSAVIYISKVDSTGQGVQPSPTARLVRALLTYYIEPATRPFAAQHIWVHLFARAQNQYLFPNSGEHAGKRVLSDVRLCAWWKRIFADVAREIAARPAPHAPEKVGLYYVLPGYDELEARQALGELSASAVDPQWTYGHPYSQTDIPLPYQSSGKEKDSRRNLGQFIPSFDDDPKARFMDEIACTTAVDGVKSPPRKRSRTATGSSTEEAGRDGEEKRIHGELGVVSPDDFWERMSFRQECISGAVTGFFIAGFSWPASSTDSSSSTPSPLAPQPGQVSHRMNRRLVSSLLTGHDFSNTERAVRATTTLEGAIRGLCDGLASADSAMPPSHPVAVDDARTTPERELPPARQTLAPPQTPPRVRKRPRVEDVTPNPFPEPVASLDTYHSYIYGSVATCNPSAEEVQMESRQLPERGPAVTILAARKKKKKDKDKE